MKRVFSYLTISIVTVVIAVLLIMTGFLNGNAYGVPLSDNVYDTVFVETIENLAPTEEVGERSVLEANREPLFDIHLNQIGFVYDFTLNGNAGFAIMIVENGVPEIAEIFFDAQNPYENVDGMRVYLSNSSYAYEKDGNLYLAKDDTIVPHEVISFLEEISYSSNYNLVGDSETVYYASRTLNLKRITPRYPDIFAVVGISNGCVPIASTNLVAYWDRYATNLIPNYEPGTPFGNLYLYKGDSETLDNVALQLYQDMKTNAVKPGTNITQFKDGMTEFCVRQGYNVSFETCMNGTKLNFEMSKLKLNAGIPLMLFVDTFAVGENYDYPDKNYEFVSYILGSVPHAMVAFGYQEINYVLTDGSERHDQYFAVASGLSDHTSGFCNINYKTQIDEVYAVSIA